MSARQLNRLAKAKGLDHLLGGTLNEELDASEGTNDSEEDEPFSRGGVVSASAFGDDSDESSSSSEEEQDSSSESDGSSDNTGSNKDEFSAANAVATATASSSSASSSSSSSASHVALTTTSPVISRNDAALETTPPPSSATLSKPQKSADPVEASPTAASPTVTSSKGRTAVRENDDQYLDNVISELASAAAAAAAAGGGGSARDEGGVTSSLARLLRCDPRCLKLDLELRRKFGAGVGGGDRENGAAGGRGGRARRPRRGMMMMRGGNAPASLALKRLVVSAPKEDWPKPPSLVGGGLGMKRCEAPAYLPPWQRRAHSGAEWFVFERSSSLEQLQRRFEAIQGMHDPNLLGAFASQAPYHADALLQLAMVFAHTGQMDRASEFVGRSLYVLESSSMEAFRPLEGACRLDATLEVNKTYLAALFRHMQMAGMVGGARTALEVGRLLLSVDPLGDPMGCLLALDSHALACYEGKFILELYESKLPIGYSPSDLSRTADTPAAAAAAATWSAYGVSRLQGTSENVIFEGPGVTVQDLPGLSMSVCLATLDNGGGTAAAREAMAETLLRFPVMLEPLLEKCGVSPRSTTYPQDWRSVMQRPHFAGARARIPTGHVLVHLASIYAERGGELWKHERAMELLYDGAGIALQGLGTASTLDAQATNGESGAPGSTSAAVAASGTAAVAATSATAATATATSAAAVTATPAAGVPAAQAFMPGKRPSASEAEILRRAYGVGSPIHKYLDLEVSDFAETFALLPQDANILNPRLMGPNFMNERVRMHMPMAAGGGGGGGGMLDVDVARVMQAFGGNGGGVMGWRGRREVGRRPQGNLDPAAPLAQLFWQTLMPWNTFPTPSNPTPPPPPWL